MKLFEAKAASVLPENKMFDFNLTNLKNTFMKELNKSLRQLFSGRIKGTFLIDVLYKVLSVLGEDINKFYDMQMPDSKHVISSSCETPHYDICRHIVGLHRSNLVFATEEERLAKENSTEYKDLLVKQVLNNVKLREYGSVYFRNASIIAGENFIFFHTPYNLFVLCLRMNELLHSCKEIDLYNQLIASITNKGTAALSLLEDNFLDNAYPICRGVIELYVKLLLLLNCPKTLITHYFKFVEFELKNTCCGKKYTKEFNDLFENRKNKKCRNKVDYLHYGWLDYIDDYGSLPYSLNGIIKYLKKKFNNQNDNFLDSLTIFYKMCHGYTHGNLPLSKYPLLHYFEISTMLYLTIANTYDILCRRLKIDTQINGIDIMQELEYSFNQLQTQYYKRSTEKFEEYYRINKI